MQIPTNPYYDIDLDGVVRLISTGDVIPEYRNHNGLRAVRIRGKSHKPSSHSLDRLLLITYKPLGEDQSAEWLSVRYHDCDRDNISLDNLDWDATWYHPVIIPGVNVPRDTWIAAYGHPDVEFRITADKVLFRNAKNWTEIGTKSYNDGYLFIKSPTEQKRVLVHRLVAMTLLPHPLETHQLVVNHRDSNVTNNNPYNLEWATYSQNSFHAYDEGPRSQTIRKIRLKHLETGEETVVAGRQEMARHMGVLPQAAHQAMERRNYEGRPYKGYIFKFEDDPRTWEELRNSGRRENRIKPDKVAVRDMLTGDVRLYTSFQTLMDSERIRDFMVFRLLNDRTMPPWRGRCLQAVYGNEPLKWPAYPEEIVNVYAKTHASDRPIAVTAISTGVTEYHPSVTHWCMEDRENRMDPAVLSRLMKRSKNKVCRWRDWVFEHIDLRQYPIV